nr:hypothetical protein [Pseudonocardia sp. EV170527-09]
MDSLAATVARMPALRAAVAADPSSHRVLTGERPTGPLHLGTWWARSPNASGCNGPVWTCW